MVGSNREAIVWPPQEAESTARHSVSRLYGDQDAARSARSARAQVGAPLTGHVLAVDAAAVLVLRPGAPVAVTGSADGAGVGAGRSALP
jgi:hypothetical protein